MLVREMGGSNQLARRLRMRIDAVAAPLYEEVTTESLYNHVLSQTLRKYIKLVDTLSTIKDVGALENSYNLALILKRWWWNPDKGWSREEFLPSTPEAGLEEFDKMLSGLIQRRRDAGQAWDVEGDLREMEREWGARAVPREPSPNPWFPESRRLLEEIMGKDSEADDSDEE
ncbi:hypothetical protein B0T21DRAFT_90506 [Apiosordaria backusii]|uniref:Uncharacterized protein n=1 Tax=Apiosordaria backusii TaxID=314023 RepID=A0AA40ESC4_9PEZI|nr:hypothetical protein B0T21DRAFT_90506 [Apiosordaria backusii]